MTKGTEPVQAWRTADGRLFTEQSDARDWDELVEFEKTPTLGRLCRQSVLKFLAWRREREKATESKDQWLMLCPNCGEPWTEVVLTGKPKRAEQPKHSDEIIEQIRHLRSEVDCRIEHGITSGGYLEYVRMQLDKILCMADALIAEQDQVCPVCDGGPGNDCACSCPDPGPTP